MEQINVIKEDNNYILCEYVDDNSPFIENKDFIFHKEKNRYILNCISYNEDGLYYNSYALVNETFNYQYNRVGFPFHSSDKVLLDNSSIPNELEFLKYFKRRQVNIATYESLNNYHLESNRRAYLEIMFKPFVNAELFQEDICKDYLIFRKD